MRLLCVKQNEVLCGFADWFSFFFCVCVTCLNFCVLTLYVRWTFSNRRWKAKWSIVWFSFSLFLCCIIFLYIYINSCCSGRRRFPFLWQCTTRCWARILASLHPSNRPPTLRLMWTSIPDSLLTEFSLSGQCILVVVVFRTIWT